MNSSSAIFKAINAWLNGIESSFQFFGCLPRQVVSDNASSLVKSHRGKSVVFTDKYKGFCDYYNVTPIATAVGKPRSKGKVERAVRYVKENALVNASYKSMEALNLWLKEWSLQIADARHLAAREGKTPSQLWVLEESELMPIVMSPICTEIHGVRKVSKDGLIRLDNLFYRLPDQYVSREVQFCLTDTTITVEYNKKVIAKLNKAADASSPRIQDKSIAKHDVQLLQSQIEAIENDALRQKYQKEKGICERPCSIYNSAFGMKANENLVLIGPPGVGKTHIAIGLGMRATRAGLTTRFYSARDLVEALLKAENDRCLDRFLKELNRVKLLIIDEFGYLPYAPGVAHLLFRLISMRYKKRSIIVTSNRAPAEWGYCIGR